MTGSQHRSDIETTVPERTTRIVRNQNNPSHRIAFADTAFAEGFIARATDPPAWSIEPVDSPVDPKSRTVGE